MTKRQLIDQIIGINRSAQPAFLAHFSDEELSDYLTHLNSTERPRMHGDPARFRKYFENCPVIPALATRSTAPADDAGDGFAQETEVAEEPFAQEEPVESLLV